METYAEKIGIAALIADFPLVSGEQNWNTLFYSMVNEHYNLLETLMQHLNPEMNAVEIEFNIRDVVVNEPGRSILQAVIGLSRRWFGGDETPNYGEKIVEHLEKAQCFTPAMIADIGTWLACFHERQAANWQHYAKTKRSVHIIRREVSNIIANSPALVPSTDALELTAQVMERLVMVAELLLRRDEDVTVIQHVLGKVQYPLGLLKYELEKKEKAK